MSASASLPAIKTAQLPALYEAAKVALAQCATIDECRTWANRMEALASYGRQADDEALVNHARRIKARAVDRAGELLREIRPATNRHDVSSGAGGDTGRMQVARDAGLSRRQTVTALRVNNVPRPQFDAMVEAANPPTIEQLARVGTRRREPEPHYLKGRAPADFQQATLLLGWLRRINEQGKAIDLNAARRGLDADELAQSIKLLSEVSGLIQEVKDAIQ